MLIVLTPKRVQLRNVRRCLKLTNNRGTSTDNITDSQRVAKAFGYSPEELQSIPANSHMGLSCGNPVAAASLQGVRKFWLYVWRRQY